MITLIKIIICIMMFLGLGCVIYGSIKLKKSEINQYVSTVICMGLCIIIVGAASMFFF